MALRELLNAWPAVRQLTGDDRLARGDAARSAHTDALHVPHRGGRPGHPVGVPVLRGSAAGSSCTPRDGEVTQVEGDPDSPISRGRLCARGSSTTELVTGPSRGCAP